VGGCSLVAFFATTLTFRNKERETLFKAAEDGISACLAWLHGMDAFRTFAA